MNIILFVGFITICLVSMVVVCIALNKDYEPQNDSITLANVLLVLFPMLSSKPFKMAYKWLESRLK